MMLVGVGGAAGAQYQGVAVTVPFGIHVPLDSPVAGFLIDSATAEGDWWRKECTKLLAGGGRLVVLCGRNPGSGLQTEFGQWLLKQFGISVHQAGGPLTIKCLTPALQRLLENDLAYNYFGESADVKRLAVAAESDGMTVAAITDVGRGQVAVLPVGITHNTIEHFAALVEAIPPAEDYPDYLDALEVPGEEQLRVELAVLRERKTQLEAELEAVRGLKRILYVGKFDLEGAVVDFLTAQLRIPARHVSGIAEDFWLTEDDHDWAIGEVKSYETGNVDKGAVGQLWTHRREAGRREDFPALLIANTHYKRSSLKEREEDIHPDVARRAREDHVLVARTLDLFRMRQSPQARDAFLETLRHRGGWFRVGPDLSGKVSPA